MSLAIHLFIHSTLTYSIVATPAFAALPLHADSQDRSNPRTTPFPGPRLLVLNLQPGLSHRPTIQISISTAVLQRAANRILRHSGSISRYPHRLLFVFHRYGLILRLLHCRRLAFSSSRYPSSSTNNSSQRVIATFSSSPPI
jgi:hypothetical protein